MKKTFIILSVIILIGIVAWYMYNDNFKYDVVGEERVVTSGHFFEGAKSEKEIVYERMGNRYGVIISEFEDEKTSKESFLQKVEHYRLNYSNSKEMNDRVYMFTGNNGSGPYFIAFHNGLTNVEINLLEGGGEKEFSDWLITKTDR